MKLQPLPCGSPKERSPNIYYNNGSGRDVYISFNNGGNFSPEMRFLVSPESRRTMKVNLPTTYSQTSLPQRIRYNPNGSGRDKYIQECVKDKFLENPNFKKSLRTYTNGYNSTPRISTLILPPLLKEKYKARAANQRQLIQRLSMPQFKVDIEELSQKQAANIKQTQSQASLL